MPDAEYFGIESKQALADRVRKEERERCAKIAELLFKGSIPQFDRSPAAYVYYKDVAHEIRKRE